MLSKLVWGAVPSPLRRAFAQRKRSNQDDRHDREVSPGESHSRRVSFGGMCSHEHAPRHRRDVHPLQLQGERELLDVGRQDATASRQRRRRHLQRPLRWDGGRLQGSAALCRVHVRARLPPTTPAPAPLGAEPECGEVWCSGSAPPTQPHPPRARNAAAGHGCRLPPPSSPHAAADSPAVTRCPCPCFLLCHRTFVRTWEKSARRSRILLRVANAT